jgi:hypothetical protein
MEITLKKKNDPSDFDPLLVFIEEEGDDGKKIKKRIVKVKIGETINLPDHEAHMVLAKHKGLFEVKVPEYKTKVMKPSD